MHACYSEEHAEERTCMRSAASLVYSVLAALAAPCSAEPSPPSAGRFTTVPARGLGPQFSSGFIGYRTCHTPPRKNILSELRACPV